MSARVLSTTVSGFDAVRLENDAISALILPALGGRVWQLTDRRRGRDWIWHRKDVALAAADEEAVYDEVWAGGWEELFPNDAPDVFEGRSLPDHGEWWSAEWAVGGIEEGDEAVLHLSLETVVRATRCTKEFRVGPQSNSLVVRYRIQSLEEEGFHFLFKQHLPVAITPACRLILPGGRVTAVDPDCGTVLSETGPFDWPSSRGEGGEVVSLQDIPAPASNLHEFVYVEDLPAGWCGVADPESGAALRMSFDRSTVPYVWLFLTYGGWRDCYTAVLEPCTNMPKDLDRAVGMGRSAFLPAGETWEADFEVSLERID